MHLAAYYSLVCSFSCSLKCHITYVIFLILRQWTDNWQRKSRTEIFSEQYGYDLQASDLYLSLGKVPESRSWEILSYIRIPFFVLKAATFNHPQECSQPKLA